ncbi:calcium-binding protein [Rhizobium sp. YIM 134829]|uniref:calcium-binding protein n=1 Tax=Rhizobium sp. YIM 134829 TaxID=3390453 RepID=UPI00397D2E0C
MATIIDGTDGNDRIVQGSDVAVEIYGYGGNDSIYLNRTDDLGGGNYVDAGSGNDTVVNYFEGDNDIDLGAGNDTYIADIRAADVDAYDVVNGEGGNDLFEVNSEQSEYYGGSGNDTFRSVGFNNFFNGGSGVDTISYILQDEDDDQAGQGVEIDLAAGEAIINDDQIEDLVSIENATGTDSADDIYGSSARNVLRGENGSDLLDGRAGNDDLYGGNGNDDLYGGNGLDDLIGGLGSDYLEGGKGADVFIFDSIRESVVGKNRDVIDDFRASEDDLVDLSGIDANTTRGGNQDFDFIGSGRFTKEAGELRFSNGVLQGDVNGDGRADFEIKLTGVTKMFDSDFVL